MRQRYRQRSGNSGSKKNLVAGIESLETRELLASSWKVDLGTTVSAVAPGWTGLRSVQYSPTTGIGWSQTPIAARAKSGPNPLTIDFHYATENQLRLDVPNGVYDVALTFGSYAWDMDQVSLSLEGQLVSSNLGVPKGELMEVNHRIEVQDGQLNIGLSDQGGVNPHFALAAVQVSPVGTIDPPPTSSLSAMITSPSQVQEGEAIRLQATASGGSGGYSYAWDLNGDGSYEVGTVGSSVDTWFPDNGDRRVGLRVTDSKGVVAMASSTIRVLNVAPTASIRGPATGPMHEQLSFEATASDPGTADVAAGLTYSWNFGDGATPTVGTSLTKATHAYHLAGHYTVQLTVSDKDGGQTQASWMVQVVVPTGVIHTHHGDIPDFGFQSTNVSVASGAWSNPAIWSQGRVPQDGDIVDVSMGTEVVYDLAASPRLQTVEVEAGGTLRFLTTKSTTMLVGNLMVLEGGTLEIGTTSKPVDPGVLAQVIIADQAIDTQADPEQYGTGLIGLGRVTMTGAEKLTFIRLAAEVAPGAQTLKLSEPATGWRIGDKIALPDTRHLIEGEKWSAYEPEWETAKVTGLSADRLTITLDRGLSFPHIGARNGDGVLEYLPHVMNLSRNVVFRSENPEGTRGHVLFTGRADVDLRYVGLEQLGRTTIDVLDNTVRDAGGQVTHIGTNQIGRYPLHFHHLVGPKATAQNGHQFTVIGTAVDGAPADGSDFNSFKWGIAVHNSHYGLIQGNAIFNVGGTGIVTEDGNESFNVFEDNFVMAVRGRLDARMANRIGDQNDGSVYWFHGFNNYVRNNIAANGSNEVQGIVASAGYNLEWAAGSQAVKRVPRFPGADVMMEGEYDLVNMQQTPILEFSGNEAYGALAVGLTIFHMGTNGYNAGSMGESVIRDLTTWHAYEGGFFGYPMDHVTFDGYIVRGHPRALDRYSGRSGWDAGDYWVEDVTIRNADIQGMWVGIGNFTNAPGTFRIENSYLRNAAVNILKRTPNTFGTKAQILPQRMEVENTRFMSWFAGSPATAIEMSYGGWAFTNYIQRDEVYVTNYNGVAGDNFQLYYEQQAADFIVPQSDPATGIVGSPEAGLTNQQNWQKHGIAIAGSVAPTGTIRRSSLRGLLRRY